MGTRVETTRAVGFLLADVFLLAKLALQTKTVNSCTSVSNQREGCRLLDSTNTGLVALQGPLQDMGEVELKHWLRTAAARAAFAAAAQVEGLLDTFAGKPQALQSSFQVGAARICCAALHGAGT